MSPSYFNNENFLSAPSKEKLKANLRKEDWKVLAHKYQVPLHYSMTKEVIRNTVLEALVEAEVIEETSIEEMTSELRTPSAQCDKSLDPCVETDEDRLEIEK